MPCLALAATLAAVFGAAPTLTYHPPDDEDERPMATSVTVGPQGSDFAFRVEFNQAPWGEACKNRCANTTLYLDTDGDANTGLQLGKGAPETGADLAITIQGTREYKETSSQMVLRARVRLLVGGATHADEGEPLLEMDNRREAERLHCEGNVVYALVDGTDSRIPMGRTMRVIYHPPGAKAMVGKVKGLMSGGGGAIEIFRKGKSESRRKKAPPPDAK